MSSKPPSTVLESLNTGLHAAMAHSESVYLIGEDLLDPYGGAFKVSRGLSTAFPSRVLTSPISEAAITGLAGGMALRGLRPVVEIMFGDFLTLTADQIINHLSKFRYMYANKVSCPVIIRTPMGGRRGYGPTHSQTLEKHFLGVPDMKVVAPFNLLTQDTLSAPGKLLYDLVLTTQDPVLFIENKLQYLLTLAQPPIFEITDENEGQGLPFYKASIKSAPPPTMTLAAYGYVAHLALQAAHQLAFEDEIFTEVLIPSQLSPFDLAPLLQSVRSTSNLLTLEEGAGALGWGAEVLSQAAEALGSHLLTSARLTGADHPVPASRLLEEASLPSVPDIIKMVKRMV